MLGTGNEMNTGFDLRANEGDPVSSGMPSVDAAEAPTQSGRPIAVGPLFENWQAWIAGLYDWYPPAILGDTLGTTFLSFGAVILSAISAGTRNEKQIAQVTSLPIGYVKFVLAMLHEHNLWDSLEPLDDLQRTLLSQRNDLGEVKLALEAAVEALWNRCATRETVAKMIELRAGRQFGGGMDTWVEEEGYDGWWVN